MFSKLLSPFAAHPVTVFYGMAALIGLIIIPLSIALFPGLAFSESTPVSSQQSETVSQSSAPVVLHMVGQSNDALHILDTASGAASLAGDATDFGDVQERSAHGLVSDGDTLYMASDTKFYTVSDAGVATAVNDDATNFAYTSRPSNPYGIGFLRNTLYMVDFTTAKLYEVDVDTGIAVVVGDQTAFGVGETSPTSVAAIGNTLYMVGSTIDALYTVNTSTGAATRVGNSTAFGVNETYPVGLATIGNTLYMIGTSTDRLYVLNTQTGAGTRVGTANQYGVSELNPTGLASDSSTLYMVGQRNDRIYTVDPATGVGTIASGTGVGASERSPLGLAHDGTNLYMTGANCRCLYRVDTAVSTAYVAMQEQRPRNFSHQTIGYGFTYHDSTVYMVSRGHLYKVDKDKAIITERVTTSFQSNFGYSETSSRDMTSLNGTLYMLGGSCVCLYSMDSTSGVATRVGIVTNFGVGESGPTGLAAQSGNLYMVGQTTDALYRVNTTTGIATQVGSASTFGTVNESSPRGLASSGSTLYMIGATGDRLYTVNTDTGIATQVGSSTRFGQNITNPWGLAYVGGTLYMTNGSSAGLYSVSTSSGASTRVGSASSFGVSEDQPTGLGESDGTLYMVGTRQDALFTVDTTNGIGSKVGNASFFRYSETSPYGLEVHNGTMYMVGSGSAVLFQINPDTGVITRVGSVTNFGVNETTPYGLASDGTNLYMIGSSTDKLYTLNTQTGFATVVGTQDGFGVEETIPTGLAYHSGGQYEYSLPDNPPQCADSHITNMGEPSRYNLDVNGDFENGSCRLADVGDVEEYYEDSAEQNHTLLFSTQFQSSRTVDFSFAPVRAFSGNPTTGQYRMRVRSSTLDGTLLGTVTGSGTIRLDNISLGGSTTYIVEVMRWGIGADTGFALNLAYAFIQEATPTPAPTSTPRAQEGVDVRIHPRLNDVAYSFNQVYSFAVEGNPVHFPVTVRVGNIGMTKIGTTSAVDCTSTSSQVSGIAEGGAFYIRICEESVSPGGNSVVEVLNEDTNAILDRGQIFVSAGPIPTPGPVRTAPTLIKDQREIDARDVLGLSIFISAVCEAAGVGCKVSLMKNLAAAMAAAAVGILPTLVAGGRVSTASLGIGVSFLILGLIAGYILVGLPLWLAMTTMLFMFGMAGLGILLKIGRVPA